MKKDRRLIAVVSGFPAKNAKCRSLKLLIGDTGIQIHLKLQKNETLFQIETWLGKKAKINATTKEDFYITVNKKDIRNLSFSLRYEGPVVAPISKNEKVGELVILNKDEIIKTLPLYAAEELKKVNFFKSLVTSINYLIWGDV